jgi:hypothetical protein
MPMVFPGVPQRPERFTSPDRNVQREQYPLQPTVQSIIHTALIQSYTSDIPEKWQSV